MYIPKLKRHKEYIKIAKVYDDSIIAKVLFLYLTVDIDLVEIERVVLNNDFKGYRVLQILQYYGFRDVHRGIFANLSLDMIIDEIRTFNDRDENQCTEVFNLLSSIDEHKAKSLIKHLMQNKHVFKLSLARKELEQMDRTIQDLSTSQIEAYYNTLSRIRNSRVQKSFRDALLLEFHSKCALCDINQVDLLVASHIIPYSRCQEDISIAGDSNNGLLLCRNHDLLFEMGNYITFDSNGRLMISNLISKEMYKALNITDGFVLQKHHLTADRVKYLKAHRQWFLDKNKHEAKK